jgi:hypothetical protein
MVFIDTTVLILARYKVFLFFYLFKSMNCNFYRRQGTGENLLGENRPWIISENDLIAVVARPNNVTGFKNND